MPNKVYPAGYTLFAKKHGICRAHGLLVSNQNELAQKEEVFIKHIIKRAFICFHLILIKY